MVLGRHTSKPWSMPLARGQASKHWSVPLAPGRVPLRLLTWTRHAGGKALYYGRGSCLAC